MWKRQNRRFCREIVAHRLPLIKFEISKIFSRRRIYEGGALMNLWFVLFKKECLEMVRNFKVIWVPLTFLFLAKLIPLTAYYMPKIIDALGGLPEGTVIEIPLPSPGRVFS